MNTTTPTCVKSLEDITGRNLPAGLTSGRKQKLIAKHVNPARYEFVGFVDRTNQAILRPRYYNVRNSLGQFAAVEA